MNWTMQQIGDAVETLLERKPDAGEDLVRYFDAIQHNTEERKDSES